MLLQQFKHYLKPMDGLILGIAVMSLIPLLYGQYWQQSGGADYALIISPNKTHKIDLDQIQTIAIQGHLGVSQFDVQEGKIRFINSPCQGKYCVHAGWQQSGGALAACLPNRILLEIHAQQTQAFDAISY